MKDILEKIRIQDEQKLLSYMENSFNVSAVNTLLKINDEQTNDRSLTSNIYRESMLLSPQIGGHIIRVAHELLEKLEFTKRPIKFCISRDPELNAYAHFNHNEDEPHYIVFNSGLLDKSTEDEIKFIIGHEVGHLIYEHSVFHRAFYTVFDNEYKEGHNFLANIYHLWRNLGEMSADRVGLLATPNFDAALSAMFKLSCGLDMRRLDVNASNFVAMTDGLIADWTATQQNLLEASHPLTPIRTKSLEILYNSKLYQNFLDHRTLIEDEELTQKSDDLIELLRKRPTKDIEKAKLDFLAAAGFYLIKSDQTIIDEEYDELMNILSCHHYWPPDYTENLLKDADPIQIIDKSAAFIVEHAPLDAQPLLNQLVPLIVKDRRIEDRELDAFVDIGIKLQIPPPVISNYLLKCIKEYFRPMV